MHVTSFSSMSLGDIIISLKVISAFKKKEKEGTRKYKQKEK